MLKQINSKIFSKPEVVIISYPKSGRNRLRSMLDYCNIKFRYSQEDSMLDKKVPFFILNNDVSKYRKHPVILLVRDPKDILTLSYLHATNCPIDKYEGTISDFIRDDNFGIRKVVAFNKIWLSNKDRFKDFMLVQFEDLHTHPSITLQKVLNFSDNKVNDDSLKTAIQYGILEGTKTLGEYENYLSREDIDYCNEVINETHYSYNDSEIYCLA